MKWALIVALFWGSDGALTSTSTPMADATTCNAAAASVKKQMGGLVGYTVTTACIQVAP